MAQPRYFLGTLYLAFAGASGANIIWEAITVGICCGVVDLYKERRMEQGEICGNFPIHIRTM